MGRKLQYWCTLMTYCIESEVYINRWRNFNKHILGLTSEVQLSSPWITRTLHLTFLCFTPNCVQMRTMMAIGADAAGAAGADAAAVVSAEARAWLCVA